MLVIVVVVEPAAANEYSTAGNATPGNVSHLDCFTVDQSASAVKLIDSSTASLLTNQRQR